MLIDGVVKRYPTAIVDLDNPYYTGMAKVLCMDTLNCWQHTRFSWPRHRHKATRCQIYITVYHRYTAERRQSGETVPETDKTPENKENQM